MRTHPKWLFGAALLSASLTLAFDEVSTPDPGFGTILGEVRIFAGNFAPEGWAFCDGQIISISQNSALFSLLGTTYGGDGESTFRLPDLRSRAPVHVGDGHPPGLPPVQLGEKFGAAEVTLTTAQMPSHGHALLGSSQAGMGADPAGKTLGRVGSRGPYAPGADVPMASEAIGTTGGGQPHENRSPSLGVNYIIAMDGIYPSE